MSLFFLLAIVMSYLIKLLVSMNLKLHNNMLIFMHNNMLEELVEILKLPISEVTIAIWFLLRIAFIIWKIMFHIIRFSQNQSLLYFPNFI